eukprot:SAG22_NODE_115_length_19315_cov_10.458368_4_plen_222_part_00
MPEPPLWQRVHCVARDPGDLWVKDTQLALDCPPDSFAGGQTGVAWAGHDEPRTGIWRTHTPSLVRLDGGAGFRMYYTESGPGLLWTQSKGRILSAHSADGETFTPEPGARLSPHAGGAEMQVTSPELVPALSADGKTLGHRLYYEAIPGERPTDGRGKIVGDGVAKGSTHIRSAFRSVRTHTPAAGIRAAAPPSAALHSDVERSRCLSVADSYRILWILLR